MELYEIRKKEKLYALVFNHCIKSNGVRFLTPTHYSLQLGLIEHPKGKQVRKHLHNPELKHEITSIQEFIYIEYGKVKVKIYEENWTLVDEVVLSKGDFILHVYGGHGFEVLENCRMIEIKQGPFPGDLLAKLFDPRDNA
ncbi:MAG: hypothetical protein A3E26_04565 [Chlamydiae bacterium RIFCSPHIGHO2_12_FULL_49_32]|nr:MAG: hypothetical protein A3E26_04565 [Chlamydiae bacterium RIFCSPHIGHO2_12_FULL_49_32]